MSSISLSALLSVRFTHHGASVIFVCALRKGAIPSSQFCCDRRLLDAGQSRFWVRSIASKKQYACADIRRRQGLSKAGASAVTLDSLLRSTDTTKGIPAGFSRRYAEVHWRKMADVW